MGGVLAGLTTIGIVIALGYLLARSNLLPESALDVLSRLVFFVAAPALLLETLSATTISISLSAGLAVTAIATTAAAVAFAVIARFGFKRDPSSIVIGSLAASYVNAGNLGIPLSVYVFGDAALMAPVLLFQMIVLGPVGLIILDTTAAGRRPSLRQIVTQPVRNPMLVASLIGIALAATGIAIPDLIDAPLQLIAGMAVPGALIAFGISLRGAPLPGRGRGAAEIAVLGAFKLLLMPAVAFAASLAFGLHGTELLAATMFAALPTAQNVFIFAVRYRSAVTLARDSVLATTIASVPVLVLLAAVLT